MLSNKRHLQAWAHPDRQYAEAAPPSLAQLGYVEANPDGSSKQCMNCTFWFASDENCGLLRMEAVAPADACCSRHIFGPPNPGAFVERRGMRPLEVGDVLLRQDGVQACQTCAQYVQATNSSGQCLAAFDEQMGSQPMVEALGRCARWEPRGHQR